MSDSYTNSCIETFLCLSPIYFSLIIFNATERHSLKNHFKIGKSKIRNWIWSSYIVFGPQEDGTTILQHVSKYSEVNKA